MSKTGFSRKESMLLYAHYDNDGQRTGYSQKASSFGDIFHYDNNGKKTGYSQPALFGGYIHFNNDKVQIGKSALAPGGGYFHYDILGHQTGYSVPAPLDGFVHFSLE